MRVILQRRIDPAKTWRKRFRQAPRVLLRVNQQNVALVVKKRKQLLRETIYKRPPISRPLTRNLIDSDGDVAYKGNVAEVSNHAPYAQIRNDMTGRSKLYGHDKTSDWAGRAGRETVRQRRANVRAAVWAILTGSGYS